MRKHNQNRPLSDPTAPPRQMTPEECAAWAKSTSDLPPQGQLTPEECEMLEEESFQKALRYGTPAEAISAMERRLAKLRELKAECLHTLDDCPDAQRYGVEEVLATYSRQIKETQERLDAYKFQHRNEN